MNLIEQELAKRRSASKERLKAIATARFKSKPVAKEESVTKKSGFSFSRLVSSGAKAVKSLDKAHDDLQSWRLKKRVQEKKLSKAIVKKRNKPVKNYNPWRD